MTIEEKIMKGLADKDSRRILQHTIDNRKTAEEISNELGIPLSSIYRKIKELKDAKLLVVEKSAVTKEGKVCDLYRSAVRGVNVWLDSEPPALDLTFNEDVYSKISRIWHTLREER